MTSERESHVAEINRRLKERGFEPGELQAFLRGLRGDQLAPFTTAEIELGLLDAFANMGGGTVWCGDGSSCAVQIVEHQISLAVRAALRERDAKWAAAIVPNGQACCSWCGYRPQLGHGSQSAAYPEYCDCCAPLRALLEEAGKP